MNTDTLREYARLKYERWTGYAKMSGLFAALVATGLLVVGLLLVIGTSGIWLPALIADFASNYLSDRMVVVVWLGSTAAYMLLLLGVRELVGGDLRTAIENTS